MKHISFILAFLGLFQFCFAQETKMETEKKDIAVVCKLTSKELQARKALLQKEVFSKISITKAHENKFEMVFNEPIAFAAKLMEFVNLERQCCPAITFSMVLEPDGGAIHLFWGDTQEIKEMVQTMYEEANRNKH